MYFNQVIIIYNRNVSIFLSSFIFQNKGVAIKSKNKIDKDNVYVILGFDAESNIGGWDNSYSGLLEGTPLLLDILDRTKIRSSFFIVGEAAKLYPDLCKEILRNGHDVGCHSLYHDIVGDPFYEVPAKKPLLPHEIKNRLEIATDLITKAVGKRPVTFRSPMLWGGTNCVKALEELGYIADATYPMHYYDRQLIPYHPSKDNWLEKGDLKILEIPNFADITIKSPDTGNTGIDSWPIYRLLNAEATMVHVHNFIKYIRGRGLPVIVCFYLHPWEFAFIPSKFRFQEGYTCPDEYLYKNTGNHALKEFEKLINYLKKEKAVFITALEMAESFQW